MATPVSANTVWLCTLRGTLHGQTILNTHHLVYNGSGTIPDYEALANQFLSNQVTNNTQFWFQFAGCVSTDFIANEMTMQPIYPNRYNAATLSMAGSTGFLSGEALPPNVSATITKRSVNATRWGRGSNHLAGVRLQDTSGGRWDAGQLVLLDGYADFISGQWAAGGSFLNFRPVLWNRTNPGRITDVTSASAQPTTRVERRRTVGLGI